MEQAACRASSEARAQTGQLLAAAPCPAGYSGAAEEGPPRWQERKALLGSRVSAHCGVLCAPRWQCCFRGTGTNCGAI